MKRMQLFSMMLCLSGYVSLLLGSLTPEELQQLQQVPGLKFKISELSPEQQHALAHLVFIRGAGSSMYGPTVLTNTLGYLFGTGRIVEANLSELTDEFVVSINGTPNSSPVTRSPVTKATSCTPPVSAEQK